MTTVAKNSPFWGGVGVGWEEGRGLWRVCCLFFCLFRVFFICNIKFQIFYVEHAISSLNPRGTIGNCRAVSSRGEGLVHQPPGVLEHYINYLLAAFLYCLYSDAIKSQYDFVLAFSKLD